MLGSTSADHDQVDPAEALLREVGAQLRQARLERAEDLNDVAQHLRIKPAYLFGLEQGDLSGLPGRTYALGFLRSYANHLGFDGEELVSRIKSSVGELTDRTRLWIRTPMPENRLPKTPMVVISLVAVIGIYLGWSYVNRSSRMVMDTVAEVPSDLRDRASDVLVDAGAADGAPAIEGPASESAAAPDGASGAPQGSETAEAAAARAEGGQATSSAAAASAPPGPAMAARSVASAPAATGESARLPEDAPEQMAGASQAAPSADDQLRQGGGDTLAVQPAAGASAVAAVDQAETAAGTPTEGTDDAAGMDPARRAVARLLDPAARRAEGAPRVYETANTDARVILRAREPSWIQVSSPAGDYTFTRTLEPGEALLVPDRQGLELWTGNAGGLEIIVDGTPVALPRGGAVRRHISLDPDSLLREPAR